MKGNQADCIPTVEGCYRINDIAYRGLPLSSIYGSLSYTKKGLKLTNNHWEIMNMSIPVECTWSDNAVHINWSDSLKRLAGESTLAKTWQKIKERF